MLWQSPIAKLAICFIAGAAIVAGQGSPVTTCIEPYAWSINSQNQTPCLVASFLESACGAPINVLALPQNDMYLGPTLAQQNECLCSSVTYSVISACAGCQGRHFQNWTTWSMNCIAPVLTTFPLQLPVAVSVPPWAFLNVSLSNNTFDPVLAENTLNSINPSSSSSSTVASSTTSSSSSASSAPESTSPTAPTTTDSKKSSHAGAIAGGVVGGLVFLAVVVLGALWWIIRKKRNAASAKDLTFDRRALVGSTMTSQPTGSSRSPEVLSTTGPYSSPLYGTSTDMSAIPTSPVTSAVYTTVPGSRRSLESVSYSLAHFGGQNVAQNRQPLGYSGAAEV